MRELAAAALAHQVPKSRLIRMLEGSPAVTYLTDAEKLVARCYDLHTRGSLQTEQGVIVRVHVVAVLTNSTAIDDSRVQAYTTGLVLPDGVHSAEVSPTVTLSKDEWGTSTSRWRLAAQRMLSEAYLLDMSLDRIVPTNRITDDLPQGIVCREVHLGLLLDSSEARIMANAGRGIVAGTYTGGGWHDVTRFFESTSDSVIAAGQAGYLLDALQCLGSRYPRLKQPCDVMLALVGLAERVRTLGEPWSAVWARDVATHTDAVVTRHKEGPPYNPVLESVHPVIASDKSAAGPTTPKGEKRPATPPSPGLAAFANRRDEAEEEREVMAEPEPKKRIQAQPTARVWVVRGSGETVEVLSTAAKDELPLKPLEWVAPQSAAPSPSRPLAQQAGLEQNLWIPPSDLFVVERVGEVGSDVVYYAAAGDHLEDSDLPDSLVWCPVPVTKRPGNSTEDGSQRSISRAVTLLGKDSPEQERSILLTLVVVTQFDDKYSVYAGTPVRGSADEVVLPSAWTTPGETNALSEYRAEAVDLMITSFGFSMRHHSLLPLRVQRTEGDLTPTECTLLYHCEGSKAAKLVKTICSVEGADVSFEWVQLSRLAERARFRSLSYQTMLVLGEGPAPRSGTWPEPTKRTGAISSDAENIVELVQEAVNRAGALTVYLMKESLETGGHPEVLIMVENTAAVIHHRPSLLAHPLPADCKVVSYVAEKLSDATGVPILESDLWFYQFEKSVVMGAIVPRARTYTAVMGSQRTQEYAYWMKMEEALSTTGLSVSDRKDLHNLYDSLCATRKRSRVAWDEPRSHIIVARGRDLSSSVDSSHSSGSADRQRTPRSPKQLVASNPALRPCPTRGLVSGV